MSFSPDTGSETALNRNKERLPFCIVWTPIPVLTWILPIVGHMGITTSSGVIRDFGGPYTVSVSTYFLFLLNLINSTFQFCLNRKTTWPLVIQLVIYN